MPPEPRGPGSVAQPVASSATLSNSYPYPCLGRGKKGLTLKNEGSKHGAAHLQPEWIVIAVCFWP